MSPQSIFPSFSDKELRIKKTQASASRLISADTISAITNYNAQLPLGEKAKANLKLLHKPFAAVVTGQQVGILGGPIMTALKALTACKVAAQLSKESGTTTIPFFWIQSEDHDFDEISALVTLSGDNKLLSENITQSSTSGTSLQFENLDASVELMLGKLQSEIGSGENAEELISALQSAYTPGVSIADAFARFYAWLFQDYGLLFVNPWQAETEPLRKEVFSKSLENYQEIESLVGNSADQTIFVRKDSPLFFYHPDGQNAPRYRLEKTGADFTLVGSTKTISPEKLAEELETSPEKFSSSALIRPIVQDTLLPTVAYIGGAAELNYFKQLSPLYKLFALEKPFVLERLHAQLIPPKIASLLEGLRLSSSEIHQSKEELLAHLAEKGLAGDAHIEEVRANILAQLETLKDPFAEIDKTLIGALENSTSKVLYQIDNLTSRYQKAQTLKSETSLNRLAKVLSTLRPDNKPQERVLSIAPFIAESGRSILTQIYDTISPLKLKDGDFEDILL